MHGQQEIHQKIKQLNFRDCKAKIRQVDAHATLASGVVVQVLGELSNNNKPMRRFMQTFVLVSYFFRQMKSQMIFFREFTKFTGFFFCRLHKLRKSTTSTMIYFVTKMRYSTILIPKPHHG